MRKAPMGGQDQDGKGLKTAWMIVGAIILIALALRFSRAWTRPIAYDEAWHIFIAGAQPARHYVSELRWMAHPPLFTLGLRWLIPLHDHLIWPRLLPLLAALGTIPLAFLCALEMGLSGAVAVLGSFLLAISYAHTAVSIEVRGYSLCLLFILAAYRSYLRLLRAPAQASTRDRFGFVAASLLAIWTEFNAVFVLAAELAVLAWEGLCRRGFMKSLWHGKGEVSPWLGPVLLAAGSIGLAAYLRWTHAMQWLEIPAYSSFFPGASEPLHRFALRGAGHALALLTPLRWTPESWRPYALGALALPLAALAIRYSAPHSPARDSGRGCAILILVLVGMGMFLASLSRLYPLGGHLRHSFVLFPFLLFSFLLALDEGYRRWPGSAGRALLAMTAVAASGCALMGFPRPAPGSSRDTALVQSEMAELRGAMHAGDAVYVDADNFICLFAAMRDWSWTRRGGHADFVDLFSVEKDGAEVIVIRDSNTMLRVPPAESWTGRLVEVLEQLGLTSVPVWAASFYPHALSRSGIGSDMSSLTDFFRSHGLQLDRVMFSKSGGAFRLKRLRSLP
ncbi:MAG: hypothetical protein HZB91_06010 [Elusimicrobia bacterium]|nr:hypothetical protein [Elusimicrobiota bacterium]